MTETQPAENLTGGCDCQAIRFQLLARPLFTHCCHCRWCQRETGSAFALNAMIETCNVKMLNPTRPIIVLVPSESGKGQHISRCPRCQIAVWSNYGDSGDVMTFVRVGTLDNPDFVPPDIHIYTSSKQPWVKLDGGVPSVNEYYDLKKYWPKASIDRRKELLGKL